MPGINLLQAPLPVAVSQAAVEAVRTAHPEEEVKRAFLEIATDLLSIQYQTTICGKPERNRRAPSVETLIKRLESGSLMAPLGQDQTHNETIIRENMGTKVSQHPVDRPLEDFEDLYYAMLAKIKDMHQLVTLRLKNGFSHGEDVLVDETKVAEDHPALTVDRLLFWLVQQWMLLNEPALAAALDSAVCRARTRAMQQQFLAQHAKGFINSIKASESIESLYKMEDDKKVQGLTWIAGWTSAMIGAWLEEKYRLIMKIEKEMKEKRSTADPPISNHPEQNIETMSFGVNITPTTSVEPDITAYSEVKPPTSGFYPAKAQTYHRMHHRQSNEYNLNSQNTAQALALHPQGPANPQPWRPYMPPQSFGETTFQHADTWQERMRRVNQYTRDLRANASPYARQLVEHNKHEVQRSMYGGIAKDAKDLAHQSAYAAYVSNCNGRAWYEERTLSASWELERKKAEEDMQRKKVQAELQKGRKTPEEEEKARREKEYADDYLLQPTVYGGPGW